MADVNARTLVMKGGLAVAAAVLMGMLAHAGQAPAAKPDDVLPALLEEVKGLRAAMEQMASAGPRVQLFVGRLQLQEARLNAIIRRLDAVRDSLASEQTALDNVEQEANRVETVIASGTSQLSREEMTGMTQVLAEAKRGATSRRAAVARLTAEEAQLTQELLAEQGRWNEINQRLDELERALGKR